MALDAEVDLCAHRSGKLECLGVGHLVVGHFGDRIWVLQAQPKILMSGAVLAILRDGGGHPDVTLVGDVLTIDGINHRVVYRIGVPDEAQRRRDLYPAEWPD